MSDTTTWNSRLKPVANTVVALGLNPAADCFSTRLASYLDRAYESGLGFVPDSTTTVRLGVPEIFSSVTQRFAPHLANTAWLLADEPDQANVPWYYIQPPTLAAEYTAAEEGTSPPILADFQRAHWSSTDEVAPCASAVDPWMGEPYGADFTGMNHAADTFNSIAPRPIWFAQDAIDASLVVPKAYWSVIGGATGVIYFTWDRFKNESEKLAAATQAFGELKELENVIMGQEVTGVEAAPESIGSTTRYVDGTVYILAANPTEELVDGKFTVRGWPQVTKSRCCLKTGPSGQVRVGSPTPLTACPGTCTRSGIRPPKAYSRRRRRARCRRRAILRAVR